MARKILIVEGDNSPHNKDIMRRGFSSLISNVITGQQPGIRAEGGKDHCIFNFKKLIRKGEDIPCLLVDLDASATSREIDIAARNLDDHHEVVFFMIQEMEAWFISQPHILDRYFGIKHKGKPVSEKLPNRHYRDIPKPKKELKDATKESNKGIYQEIRDGVELLQRLDAKLLYQTDEDFKRLIDFLNG